MAIAARCVSSAESLEENEWKASHASLLGALLLRLHRQCQECALPLRECGALDNRKVHSDSTPNFRVVSSLCQSALWHSE